MKTAMLTLIAMISFAGNSLLCRLALTNHNVDPASFTLIRIISGALVLWLLTIRNSVTAKGKEKGDWSSALALFIYAACFSFAYIGLQTGVGALLLFCSVQITMIAYGLCHGEILRKGQIVGNFLALTGLFALLLPGISTPPLGYALLMVGAGVAWGWYSLRGRNVRDALHSTAGNFARAVYFAVIMSLLFISRTTVDWTGFGLAIFSGSVASGLGYVIWYKALSGLRTITAGIVQLSVPVFAAVGGVIFLEEGITLRTFMASCMILGGIFWSIRSSHKFKQSCPKD